SRRPREKTSLREGLQAPSATVQLTGPPHQAPQSAEAATVQMIWAAEGSPHRNDVFSRGLFTRALDVRSVSSRGVLDARSSFEPRPQTTCTRTISSDPASASPAARSRRRATSAIVAEASGVAPRAKERAAESASAAPPAIVASAATP